MLVPDNVHPDQTVYYNGAFVLKAIQASHSTDFLDLYASTIELREMSMPLFVLCVDWLYLIGLVKFNDHGRLELCS